MADFTIARPTSIQHAREVLCAATPPNQSVTQLRNFSEAQIDRALGLGLRRPQWIWFASDGSAETLGVVAGWGAPHREAPLVLDFLDLPGDPEIARALIARAADDSGVPGRPSIEVVHFVPTDGSPGGSLESALAGAGFREFVRRRRYQLEVDESEVRVPSTELTFTAVAGESDPRLPAIFEEVLVGSLDAHDRVAHDRVAPASGDIPTVAAMTAREYLELDGAGLVFLASDPRGEVVGVVIGGLRGTPTTGTVSYVGVSNRHRGTGYAGQMLGWITGSMIDAGAKSIVGETDEANVPMADAFVAIGYPQTESRIDFVRAT